MTADPALEERAALHGSQRSNLPDSAFAYIEPGGTKDADGRTRPDSLRHFPIHDAGHVRNALTRIAQGAQFGDKALPKVKAAAKKFGVKVSDDSKTMADRAGFELLKRRRGSMSGELERRRMSFESSQLELRAKPNGTGGCFYELDCYGSVFDAPFKMWDKWGDEYEENVVPAAFKETLGMPGLDTPLLLGHNDQGLPFARTSNGKMALDEDSHGLHVAARRLNGDRSDVRDMVIAVNDGDLSEVSIGFVTRGQEWSEDYSRRDMTNLDLHRGDVSLVALAANPATKGAFIVPMPGETDWSAPWRPDGGRYAGPVGETLMLGGTALRLPMIDAALDQAQAIFAKQDLSKLPPDLQDAIQLVGSANIHVDHILKKEGLPDPDQGSKNNFAAPGDPAAEERASPIDSNLGDASDYNPGPKAAPDQVCVNVSCPQNGTRPGDPQARYCPRCGQMLGGPKDMSGGSKVITLENGIPSDERVGGVGTLSQQQELELLALRKTELELLALGA